MLLVIFCHFSFYVLCKCEVFMLDLVDRKWLNKRDSTSRFWSEKQKDKEKLWSLIREKFTNAYVVLLDKEHWLANRTPTRSKLRWTERWGAFFAMFEFCLLERFSWWQFPWSASGWGRSQWTVQVSEQRRNVKRTESLLHLQNHSGLIAAALSEWHQFRIQGKTSRSTSFWQKWRENHWYWYVS